MKSFKEFISEDKEAKEKNNQMWKELDVHDRNLPEPHKTAVDDWVGVSHDLKGDELMKPEALENSHEQVHAQNQPLRDVISKHHGTHIVAYRGTTPNGDQSEGRKNDISSWTTSKKAALYFSGGNVASRSAKVYSPKEISKYREQLSKTGKLKLGRSRYERNKDGYIDYYNRGEHITQLDGLDHFSDHLNSNNEYAKEHNEKLAKNRRESSTRIVKKRIPVNDIVHATNRTGQEELIVKNR